jgi:hypothetical protein
MEKFMAAKQIYVSGDDKDELIEALKEWLEILEGPPAEEPAEDDPVEVEDDPAEEPVEDEPEAEDEPSPMDVLRSKLVDRIRAMSKKPDQIEKIRAAFKAQGIKKFDDATPDKKLPALAKALGVKA